MSVDPSLVAHAAVFHGVEAAVVTELAAAARSRRLADGEYLAHQGDLVEFLVLVATGALRLVRTDANGREVIVRIAPAGEIVAGVVILPEPWRLPVALVAEGATAVWRWPREMIRSFVGRCPQLGANIVATMASRMQESIVRVEALHSAPVESRLAHTVCDLANRQGVRVPEGVALDGLGRQQLADMVGASMFTVSRLLAAWQREGLVKLGRERVVLRDALALAQRAG